LRKVVVANHRRERPIVIFGNLQEFWALHMLSDILHASEIIPFPLRKSVIRNELCIIGQEDDSRKQHARAGDLALVAALLPGETRRQGQEKSAKGRGLQAKLP